MKTTFEIIPLEGTQDEFISLHQIFQTINEEGESFPYPTDCNLEDFKTIWCQKNSVSYIAKDPKNNTIGGAYFFKPQWPGRGSHVATATYMVSNRVRGNGLGRQLALHSLKEAFNHGYQAMQFNYVVSTNTSAVNLWKSLDFEVIGTLPGVFQHDLHGPVDAYVMFKNLADT